MKTTLLHPQIAVYIIHIYKYYEDEKKDEDNNKAILGMFLVSVLLSANLQRLSGLKHVVLC